MLDFVKETVSILALIAGLAALVLFLLAAGAAVVAAYRVGFKRRPLVLTFAGSDQSRAALTALFAMQLQQIEKECDRARERRQDRAGGVRQGVRSCSESHRAP